MVTIKSKTSRDNYETIIHSSSEHELISDEPQSLGGQNKGMSPDELVIAALASCTSATLKMYAQRKTWDLQEVKTEITFTHGKAGELPTIHRDIELVGDLTEEQKERLFQIANKCPIHRVLTNAIEVSSELKNID
jgi:putative redox protein